MGNERRHLIFWEVDWYLIEGLEELAFKSAVHSCGWRVCICRGRVFSIFLALVLILDLLCLRDFPRVRRNIGPRLASLQSKSGSSVVKYWLW
jgi:hypothetical protein